MTCKSATLKWNIVYSPDEILKHEFLNLSFNDIQIQLGPKNKKKIALLARRGISVHFDIDSVIVRTHKLNYGDTLNCSVEAFGQTASFQISNISKAIFVRNVKGKVIKIKVFEYYETLFLG